MPSRRASQWGGALEKVLRTYREQIGPVGSRGPWGFGVLICNEATVAPASYQGRGAGVIIVPVNIK